MSVFVEDYVSASNPGIKTKKFTIKSSIEGFEASVIGYAAAITNLTIPGKDGKAKDIIQGCRGLDEYMNNPMCHGSVVGRSANRTKGAAFVIDGETYHIPANEGENNLHSGNPGFHNSFWEGEVIDEDKANDLISKSGIAGIADVDGDAVLFSYTSPDGATGFPGNLETNVLYAWLTDRTFLLMYVGKSDKATIFAPTNHSYWNVAGYDAGYVGEQLIMVNADEITIKDENNCPNGEVMKVDGTVFDCREYRFISELIDSDDPQIVMGKGIDQNFLVKGEKGTFSFAAAVTDPVSGSTIECLTDLPGIQIYAANNLNNSPDQKGDTPYAPYTAICLEAQMVPNAVNLPQFDSPVIKAGETCYHAVGYRFPEA